MIIADTYSHLNAEEYLIVHHKKELKEIKDEIKNIDASKYKTKVSKEEKRKGQLLYNPGELNKAFEIELAKTGWKSKTRTFFVSKDYNVVQKIEPLTRKEQKEYLQSIGHPLYDSSNQTDFLKNKIGVEVQMGKYFSVTYDLFVKHLSFYNGQIINVGIEIVPTKKMQNEMSSGPPWFEKEVHNIMRHGRTNPPVPLLLIGIEPK